MTQTVVVIDADPGLAEVVGDRGRASARPLSMARVVCPETGTWNARSAVSVTRGGIGLLVLDGIQLRRVGLGGRYGAELLGPGDIIRPWQHDGEETGLLPYETVWRVFAPTRLAVLDRRWTARMAPWPDVASEMVGRALQRSLRLATLMAISQNRRLDVRLRLLLWELADRFGIVRPDGVHLDIPLTHEALGYLAVARRPSVSTAIGRLADAGELRQDHRRIVLLGDPPVATELDDPDGSEAAVA